uniref:Uncharacterized protein n=1 Tax=Nymphaea colorata TaxID=210225 RepID=A0A5K1H4V0_9MAGN
MEIELVTEQCKFERMPCHFQMLSLRIRACIQAYPYSNDMQSSRVDDGGLVVNKTKSLSPLNFSNNKAQQKATL